MSDSIARLRELGQSIWYDYIRRDMFASGEMQRLVDGGVTGMTSNPAIFAQAIAGSDHYDAAILELSAQGLEAKELYEAIAIEDIQRAADVLRPVYDATDTHDGYISLEVSPLLANDTEGTIAEARRLWSAVDRPNLMIKVPATDAGFPAITTLIAEGINVNVTLIFALDAYERVADAFLAGLEMRKTAGLPIDRVASVASFFVSRVDTAVDAILDERAATGEAELAELRGQAAIANAKLAYDLYRRIFTSERFTALGGAQTQRVLWASTSTKDPSYRDVIYVETLIGPDTVNTMPPNTLEAFADHGVAEVTLTDDVEGAKALLQRLTDAGIDLDAVTDALLTDGVAKFAKPFEALLEELQAKRASLQES